MLRFIIFILVVFNCQYSFSVSKNELDNFLDQAGKQEGKITEMIGSAKKAYDKLEESGELKKIVKNEYENYKKVDVRDTDYKFNSIEKDAVSMMSGMGIDEYKSRMDIEREKIKSKNSLIILVSFSMPRELLIRYMSIAGRIGASVVFRGFHNNSYRETIEKLSELNIEYGFLVDPTVFTDFSINYVPAFLLVTEGEVVCIDKDDCPAPNHIKAMGTMSVKNFLEEAGNKNKKAHEVAAEWLSKLND